MSKDREILTTLAETLDPKAAMAKHRVRAQELREVLLRAAAALENQPAKKTSRPAAQAPSAPLEREVILHVDGACRGNPGPSGAGFLITKGGKVIEGQAQYLGRLTNNQAEYNALILGLTRLLELAATAVTVKSDSELMVRQMNGVYRVKDRRLQGLFARASELAAQFASFKIEHVPREQNQPADRLANRAIDEFS